MKKNIVENGVKQDPAIVRFLEKMPKRVANSFSEEQLTSIKTAIGARDWGNHKVDIRGTVKFFKWRFYYVLLLGRNRRSLSTEEKKLTTLISSMIITVLIILSIVLAAGILYLTKSALGIDLIEGWSLGLWTWLQKL